MDNLIGDDNFIVDDNLIVDVTRHESAPSTLLVYPPAGAGAGFFACWEPVLSTDMNLAVVRLPGREDLFLEEPLGDMAAITSRVTAELAARDDRELFIYGSCTGGLLAYDLAHRLRREDVGRPRALIVSSTFTPASMALASMHKLPEPELKAYFLLGETDDYPDEVWELASERIRADLQAVEHSNYPDGKLDLPFIAIRGEADDILDAAENERWADYAGAEFEVREVPGGHFLMNTTAEGLAREMLAIQKAYGGVSTASHPS